jgi:glycosyltransferase involved in cell wall biosynthesis
MRLLYVHECFGALGGAEANVYITATELKRRGHVVGIMHGPATGKSEADWSETFADRFPWRPDQGREWTAKVLAAFRPDVVYVHKMPDLDVLEVLVTSGLPLVRMVHDHDIYCMRSYRYPYFSRAICTRPLTPYCVFPCCACLARNRTGGLPFKWVSFRRKKREIHLNQQFHRMVVATNYMKEQLLINGFDPRRIEIHAPIPRPADSMIRSSFSDRNLIVYAGQIIRRKGVDVLIEALALVRTPFECVILGDGNRRSFCEKLNRRLGLDHRILFKGYVSQEELKQYYRECCLLAISSVWPEPMTLVGLEAMRCALPVVAFDAGGIKEWLTDGYNGFLVRWMDRPAYASRVEQLLKNKTLARTMGERGYERASRDYDFEKYLTDLERMLNQVAVETGAQSAY